MHSEEQFRAWAKRIYRDLMRLMTYRREWRETTDAWRANRGFTFPEGVTRWIAGMYGDWVTLAIRKQDDRDKRSVCLHRVLRTALAEDIDLLTGRDLRKDLDQLGALARRAREHANKIAAHHSEVRLRFEITFGEVDELIDQLLQLARPYMSALGPGPLVESVRQYNHETVLRRAWMEPQWRPCTWPERRVERTGEHFPILDFLAKEEHGRIVERMDNIVAVLADLPRGSESPIRGALEELSLPASDAAVQLAKDELMARGIDWRPKDDSGS